MPQEPGIEARANIDRILTNIGNAFIRARTNDIAGRARANGQVGRNIQKLLNDLFWSVIIMAVGAITLSVLLVVVIVLIVSGLLRGSSNVAEVVPTGDWLDDHGLMDIKQSFPDNTDFTYRDFIQLPLSYQSMQKLDFLPAGDQQRIVMASKQEFQKVAVEMWMKENNIDAEYPMLYNLGLTSLESLADVTHQQVQSIVQSYHYTLARTNYYVWTRITAQLKENLQQNPDLETAYVDQFIAQGELLQGRKGVGLMSSAAIAMFVSLLVYIIVRGLSSNKLRPSSGQAVGQVSMTSYLSGTYLSPQKCQVKWCWEEPQCVGSTLSFEVHFVMYNGKPYPISKADNVLIDISRDGNKIGTTEELGLTDNGNVVKVSFSVIQSGEYWVKIRVGGWDISGSPFIKTFESGPPVSSKTRFTPYNSTIVLTSSVPYVMYIEPRDQFNNLCKYNHFVEIMQDYTVKASEAHSHRQVVPSTSFSYRKVSGLVEMTVIVQETGCFQMKTFYKDETIQNGECNAIVLSGIEAAEIQSNSSKESHNIYYKSQLLPSDNSQSLKTRKVYCYISPRQLTIKEFYLRIFPKRLHTFRVCPSTKFEFRGMNNRLDQSALDESMKQTVVIDDGTQPPVEIASKYANMIVATFTSFLLKNIGGSETFKDKQEFFYHELRLLQQKQMHSPKNIQIQRMKLLESLYNNEDLIPRFQSFKAMDSFSLSDWLKRFEIRFVGEEGLDWGGLRREWFELICGALFDPNQSGLFKQYKDDSQGLCLPNTNRPESLKLKYYEFAGKIVGKCLYESALGTSYYQAVKAKFARSFLAQLIGLRVNYKYFEQDDPDLYVSKVKYFEENDPTDMDVYFIEEEYNTTGQLVRTVELCPGGAKIQVTEDNKIKYLNALAQYRLVDSVREEVERFLKGLNEIVPDNLLSIFDENELELLMCGTGECKVADLKAHHVVTGYGPSFAKTLDWFWTIVGSFNPEQMARLLQFTTGSSQLPPEGFSALCPNFQISPLPTQRGLPMAHTCFNQLCLPDYENIEQFHQALLLAINEGSQGFGFA